MEVLLSQRKGHKAWVTRKSKEIENLLAQPQPAQGQDGGSPAASSSTTQPQGAAARPLTVETLRYHMAEFDRFYEKLEECQNEVFAQTGEAAFDAEFEAFAVYCEGVKAPRIAAESVLVSQSTCS